MKRLACVLVLVLAAAFATGCGSSNSAATVNGEAIDRDEFLDQLAQISKINGGTDNSAPTDQGADLLTYHIVAALRAEDMTRLGLKATDDDLAAARAEVEGGGLPEGISQDFIDFLVRVRADQNVLGVRISDADQPWYSADDVSNYYEFVKDTQYSQFCSHHILVDAEADADEILGLLENGGDFAQLAKDRSTDTDSGAQGGDLGCNAKGAFIPEFEDPVLAAQTGDTLGPIKSEFGYHIIRVDKEYSVQPLDDALRSTIGTTLANEQGWLTWKMYTSKIKVNKKYGSWSNDRGSVIAPVDPTAK